MIHTEDVLVNERFFMVVFIVVPVIIVPVVCVMVTVII